MELTFFSLTLALVVLTVVLISGIWIAIGLAGLGLALLYFFLPVSLFRIVETIQYEVVNDFVLAAIPLFIFMGSLLLKGNIATKIYQGLAPLMSRLPGGLLQTNITSCAIFGACSGSSLAGAATMGTLAVNELRDRGYDRRLVYGSLAAGGTLATMIPPSILFILYGSFAGQSISTLFIAGLVPALILVLAFMAYVALLSLRYPPADPERDKLPWGQTLAAMKSLVAPLALITAVLGSIYTGFATPTESAAVGAMGALLILALERRLSLPTIHEAAVMSIRTTCMIALMMIGAHIISTALSFMMVPQQISQLILALEMEPWHIALIVGLLFIVLGCLIEGTSMFFLTFPIIYPLMMSLGFDPIWFGVMMALFIEMSLITPPVGLNLFIINQVAGENGMSRTIRGSLPFFFIMVLVMCLLIAFPEIVLFLPNLL
ncbi:TRAP transporter large permease [Bisbaumannia pacifica]|uniref:TRAP transporter large permease protein n=1 Tax=Bisbaumannia pacifica TaxID=77098 RepID=A0ABD4L2H2_9GAMM|nr:TRAP transporter large permease [Halomonas pacifica]MBH8580919.1 TRAP transporter large permease [Halomonas pacifica]